MTEVGVSGAAFAATWSVQADALGGLLLQDAQGVTHRGLLPVRAFPITDPRRSIALVDAEGRELLWIERLDDLPASLRDPIEAALRAREFTPRIERVEHVSSFVTPCTWTVITDKGRTRFVLKGEEAIRRLPSAMLLIDDSNGIHYLVQDTRTLDEHSRKLIDRFL